MSKPVVSRARLVTVGAAFAAVAASLLVLPTNAFAAMSVDRAELDDGLLRLEGEDAVPHAIVSVTSAESSASGLADEDGRFRLLVPNFQSSNCQVTVTDGATSAQVTLDECTPTVPPTTAPPTTAATTTDDGYDDRSSADDDEYDDDNNDSAAGDDHHVDHDYDNVDHNDIDDDRETPRRRHRRRRWGRSRTSTTSCRTVATSRRAAPWSPTRW